MKGFGIICLGLILTCCATPVVPQADGGDESAATVDFTFTLRGRTRPDIDWTQLQAQAVQRCEAWNYQYALNEEETDRVCINRSNSSSLSVGVGVPGAQRTPLLGSGSGACREYKYTITYQCTNVID